MAKAAWSRKMGPLLIAAVSTRRVHIATPVTEVLDGSAPELRLKIKDVLQKTDPEKEGYEFFSQLVPQPEKCSCTLQMWDQYAVCESAFQKVREGTEAYRAYSFGVSGYDPWGHHMQTKHGLVPELYDCFDHIKPADFTNNFHPVCLNDQGDTLENRQYTTLAKVLQDAAPRSVLIKMDIEHSEFGVLETLSDEDYGKILALNVEFHYFMFQDCEKHEEDVKKGRDVLLKVGEHLRVVDSVGDFYGDLCDALGVPWPHLLFMSYAAPETCD